MYRMQPYHDGAAIYMLVTKSGAGTGAGPAVLIAGMIYELTEAQEGCPPMKGT